MLKVKEYASFDKFEQDEHRQDVDLVAIVNKPNGMVCADFSESEREPQGGCSAWLTTGRSAGAFPIPCR